MIVSKDCAYISEIQPNFAKPRPIKERIQTAFGTHQPKFGKRNDVYKV